MSDIKAVLLDVDNTLLDFPASAKEAAFAAAVELGYELPEDLMDHFEPINNGLWEAIERKELTIAGLREVRWNRIFEAVGFEGNGPLFEDTFRKYLNRAAVPVEGAKELVTYLNGKYILAIATNGPTGQQKDRLTIAGLWEEGMLLLSSEAAGSSKPDPAFFAFCLDHLKPLTPAEIVMIGDSQTADIEGAAAAGIRTCRVDLFEERSGACDWRVRSLQELQEIF